MNDYVVPPLPDSLWKDLLELKAVGLTRVIDIGCYDGTHTAQLIRAGFDVKALDIRPRPEIPNNVFIHGDAREIDKFGTYDIALCANLIYHLENPVDFLRKLRNCAKVVFLRTMVWDEPRHFLEGYEGLWLPQEDYDYCGSGMEPTFVFSTKGLDDVMKDIGFVFMDQYDEYRTKENSPKAWLTRRYYVI